MDDQRRLEEKSLKRSMIAAFLLAVWGIAMAWVSGSGAVMLDGMYNLISAIMTFFSIEITRLVYGKETRNFPLGYFAFESLFVLVKGASILVLVVMAIYSNLTILIQGGREPVLGLMILYVAVAVAGCIAAYGLTRIGGKQTGSEILEAEAQAWLLNALVTGTIGIAFVITLLIQNTAIGWITRYVDQVLVIAMCLLFIREPLVLVKKGLKELLLAAPQEAFSAPLLEKIEPMKAELGARSLSFEILKTGRRIWLTVFMDPLSDNLVVNDFLAHKARLQAAAQEVYANTSTELIIERKVENNV